MFVRTSYKEKERILINALNRAKPLAKEAFTGSGVAPFVGRFGYPEAQRGVTQNKVLRYPFINVGLMAPPEIKEDAWKFDAPKFWAETNHQIADIVNYRAGLINSSQKANVKSHEKIVELAQEVAMASKPVDLDVQLEKKPRISISPDQFTAPMGPQGKLKAISLASNPKISSKVEALASDDVLASEAVTELYNKNYDENSLSRMFSVGVFGKNKKLVPTRWSITATDDIIANNILKEVRNFPIGGCSAFSGSYLGNYYLILFFSERWRYELFEIYAKNTQYSTDYEPFAGRKNYAENCAGGYYTVRLAVAEHLKNIKRQCGVLVLRFITDEYLLPLGVWVTREASRKALSSKHLDFADKSLMLIYAKHWSKKKFNLDISSLLEKSKLLKEKDLSLVDF